MPTTTQGLYEVILEQDYRGENVKNVFHYLATLGQDDDQDQIAISFDLTILPALALIQNPSVLYQEVRVANLTGLLADYSLVPTTPAGLKPGSDMASFVAMPFRYVRTSKETRNGAKRFVGTVEEEASAGGWMGAFLTQLQTMAVVLAGQITGGAITADPVILRKPDISGVWLYNEVSNVLAVAHQTTQNSRKKF